MRYTCIISNTAMLYNAYMGVYIYWKKCQMPKCYSRTTLSKYICKSIYLSIYLFIYLFLYIYTYSLHIYNTKMCVLFSYCYILHDCFHHTLLHDYILNNTNRLNNLRQYIELSSFPLQRFSKFCLDYFVRYKLFQCL